MLCPIYLFWHPSQYVYQVSFMKIDQEIHKLEEQLEALKIKRQAYANDPMLELIDKVQAVRFLSEISHRQLIDIILLHDLTRTSKVSHISQDS